VQIRVFYYGNEYCGNNYNITSATFWPFFFKSYDMHKIIFGPTPWGGYAHNTPQSVIGSQNSCDVLCDNIFLAQNVFTACIMVSPRTSTGFT